MTFVNCFTAFGERLRCAAGGKDRPTLWVGRKTDGQERWLLLWAPLNADAILIAFEVPPSRDPSVSDPDQCDIGAENRWIGNARAATDDLLGGLTLRSAGKLYDEAGDGL